MSDQTTVAVEDEGRYTNVVCNGDMIASYDERTGAVCYYKPDSNQAFRVEEVEE